MRRGYVLVVEDVVARGSDAGWAFREPLAAWSETRLRAFVGTIPVSTVAAVDLYMLESGCAKAPVEEGVCGMRGLEGVLAAM